MFKSVIALLMIASGLSMAGEAQPEVLVNEPAFHAKLLEIAASYEKFGRVDGPRFAPQNCAAPPISSLVRMSESKDAETHGKKLYFLFASDRNAYLTVDKDLAVGQSVVKESWIPKEVPADTQMKRMTQEFPGTDQKGAAYEYYLPYLKKDGKVYHAETKSAHFIMLKLDPKTANTDEGWIYGTVTADGKTVTSAGRVQSCMSCHKDAPHGRLFGLQTEKAPKNADATELKKLLGSWSGKWVDNWHYAGQGGELSCTMTEGAAGEVKGEFKAPGFMKDATNVTLKIRSDDGKQSTSGAIEMGKPAGTLVFKIQFSGDTLSGDYESPEERGTFEMKKK